MIGRVVSIVALSWSALSVNALPIALEDAADFKLFVFSHLSITGSTVNGSIAAGGNLPVGHDISLTHYSLTPSSSNTASIVSNGSVFLADSGSLSADVYANSISAPNYLSYNYAGNSVIDFAKTKNHLSNLSTSLALEQANGSVINQSGVLVLRGNGLAGQQIFNVSAADISKAYDVRFESLSPGQEVIVNVSGQVIDMDWHYQFKGSSAENLFFNFFEATDISIKSTKISASILAPLANVVASSGDLEGQLIANSWTSTWFGLNEGRGFAHNTVAQPVAPEVPLPSAALLFLSSLALVVCTVRRRRFE